MHPARKIANGGARAIAMRYPDTGRIAVRTRAGVREKELRIALVCFGGVSLAVYMHGITKEILKLARASSAVHGMRDRAKRRGASFFDVRDPADPEFDTEAVYFDLIRDIGQTLELRVIVDIVAGASAGGINSAMLARALSHDLPMDRLRDLWLDFCGKNGLNLEGDVFEGTVWNVQSENHGGSGVRLAHGRDGGVLSNVFLYAPNVSRNQRYGIEAANGASSIQLQFPSMINNWLGGGYFPNGVRNVIGGNCENTGQVCMDVPSSDFQTRIVGLETSTDCATKGPGGGSQPTRYFYRYGGDAAKMKQSDNVIVPYGTAANCTGVALRAP